MSNKSDSSDATPTNAGEENNSGNSELQMLAISTVAKSKELIQLELDAIGRCYVLLAEMNENSVSKYSEARRLAEKLVNILSEKKNKKLFWEPFMAECVKLDEALQELETCVFAIDAYSKRIETKYKTLPKL